MESVLVTGANRGIGLEFVRQLSNLEKPPKYIFATYRNEHTIKDLEAIQKSSKKCEVTLIKLDVTNLCDVQKCRHLVEDRVGERGLTLLVNNAGLLVNQPFPNLTEDNLLLHFTTNTIGPVKMIQEFLPLLQRSSARPGHEGEGMSFSRGGVLNISSMGGSLGLSNGLHPAFPGVMPYMISKAALNMAMRVIAASVREQRVLVVSMCPGWVRTDMGTDAAEITVAESVSSALETIATLDHTHQGTFLDRNGKAIPF